MDYQAILDQYAQQLVPQQMTPEEIRRAQIRAAGVALMGARRGREGEALARAGMFAMGVPDQLREQQRMQQQAALQNMQAIGQLRTQQTAADKDRRHAELVDLYLRKPEQDLEGYQKALYGLDPNAALALEPKVRQQQIQKAIADAESARAAPPQASGGMQPPPASQSALAAPSAPPAGLSGAPAGTPREMAVKQQAEKLLAEAEMLRRRGFFAEADQLAQKAIDLLGKLPKRAETRVVTIDGRRRLANVMDDGTAVPIEGMGPDMEKLHFADTGGRAAVGIDPYTGLPRSAGVTKTLTPDGAAAQARENLPTVQSDPNGGFFLIDRKSGQGRPVTGPDGQPLAKHDKPLTESQAKATAFANQMSAASTVLDELDKGGFTGKGWGQQAGVSLAGTEGIPYVPGSAAFPRAMASERAQKFNQAQLQWTEAALRFMTGANAPKEEVVRNAATYFPQPGDSGEKIAQKAAMRAEMERSVRMAAGPGIRQLPSMPGAKPPTAPNGTAKLPPGVTVTPGG